MDQIDIRNAANSLRPGISKKCVDALIEWMEKGETQEELDRRIDKIMEGQGDKRIAAIEKYLIRRDKVKIVAIDGSMEPITMACIDSPCFSSCTKSYKTPCDKWEYGTS